MSHFSDFANATAAAVLLDVGGDAVVHWPGGVEAAAAEVTAIVDLTELTGEGGSQSDLRGRGLEQRGLLTLRKSVEVTAQGASPTSASVFVIDGRHWIAERIVGRDQGADGLQTVAIVRQARSYTGRVSR